MYSKFSEGQIKLATERLTQDQQKSLIFLCQQGGVKAKDTLVKSYLKWIKEVARKYSGMEADDLFQLAVLGFLQAINTYEDKGGTLGTYAMPFIRNAILNALGSRTHHVSFKQKGTDKMWQVRKVYDSLCQTLLREPTSEEVHNKLKGSIPYSLIKYALTDFNIEVEVGTCDSDTNTRREVFTLVSDAITQLPVRDRYILRRRLGLIDGYKSTAEEISKYFGTTSQAIYQREKEAKEKLKRILGWDLFNEVVKD